MVARAAGAREGGPRGVCREFKPSRGGLRPGRRSPGVLRASEEALKDPVEPEEREERREERRQRRRGDDDRGDLGLLLLEAEPGVERLVDLLQIGRVARVVVLA